MLTIQSFLLKFRNLHISKDAKKNVKYAMLIFAYAFIAVFMVLKFNVFQISSDKKTLEAFAAQNITVAEEETPVLSEMEYLSLALDNTSMLKQNQFISFSGQAPLIAADIYAGDLLYNPELTTKAMANIVVKTTTKLVQTMSADNQTEQSKSAVKEETEDAKETMNTGVAVLSLSSKEIEILQRIVEAEATGEDLKGKILVANVIMNRVNDSSFPDSVEEVVFQNTGGTYQFSPISDKRYYSVDVSDETKEAVQRVIQGEDYSQGALYFSARKRASASNMQWFDNNLKWLFQYGGHEFFTHK